MADRLVWKTVSPGVEEAVMGGLTLRVWIEGPGSWVGVWSWSIDGIQMARVHPTRRAAVKACKYAAKRIGGGG